LFVTIKLDFRFPKASFIDINGVENQNGGRKNKIDNILSNFLCNLQNFFFIQSNCKVEHFLLKKSKWRLKLKMAAKTQDGGMYYIFKYVCIIIFSFIHHLLPLSKN
jgi:hypothetical protein